MSAKKRKGSKIRTEFRKRYETRSRKRDFTRDFQVDENADEKLRSEERVSGKGSLTRKRTIVGSEITTEEGGPSVELQIDLENCKAGRVLSLHGLACMVQLDEGNVVSCATRGILKSLSMDQRNVVVAGDRVQITMVSDKEGVIERVEPRYGMLSRSSKNRQHVIVSNVDLLVIVSSAAEPAIKPNLIDRFLVTAEKSGIQPLICINKIDLIPAEDLQPLIGVYGQLGYPVLLSSAESGHGIDELKQAVRGRQSVFAGQSGVGKSSLLNAIEPNLNQRVSAVSSENQKGRHTTTTARLFALKEGGFLVDTPGIRQFALWDVIPEEIAGFFRDLRPFVNVCRYPDCSHTHEDECGVKDAVADGKLDARRYESYCQMHLNDSPTK